MPPSHLHVIGVSAGSVTGWYRVTVPRTCIFGDETAAFLDFSWGEITGPEPKQAMEIARTTRGIQSMDYMVGPGLILEDFDGEGGWDAEDMIQLKIGAMLDLLKHQGLLDDAVIARQSYNLADEEVTDAALRKLHMYFPDHEHITDAARQAMTALRRARADEDFAELLWPYRAWVDD
jgi:hypothetical protein